jgi:hypothetical protein
MNTSTTVATTPTPVPVSPWIWPGLLILGPASVVVACVITAYFVLQHPDGLVATDYYKAGQAIGHGYDENIGIWHNCDAHLPRRT